MQEEWLQESGEQMLARVEYALRQEHAAVSWGLPSPRWSLQQDQRNRRWVRWHLCFSILVGLLCQQLAPANWEGVWWLWLAASFAVFGFLLALICILLTSSKRTKPIRAQSMAMRTPLPMPMLIGITPLHKGVAICM